MFTVKWVVRGKEAEPLECETFRVHGADCRCGLPLQNGCDAA
jgi:hypothetical protein